MTRAARSPSRHRKPGRWPRPRPSVRLRLTAVFTGLFLVAGAGLLALSYFLVNHREHRSGTSVQVICGLSKNSVYGVTQVNGRTAETLTPGTVVSTQVKCSQTVKDGTGFVYFGQAGLLSGTGPIGAPPGSAIGPGPNVGGEPVRVLNKLVADSQAHTLHSLLVESSLGLGVMAVLSVAVGWFLAGRVLRPVHRITDTARRLSERNLEERIRLDGPDDELKELADTFDAMLSRLERAFHSQKRFVANASHELRTPLATERVLIDEALTNRDASPQELRSILEQLRLNSDETEGLIDALLVLARSERGLDRREAVDVAGTARQVVERVAATEAVTNGVQVRSALRPAAIDGDRGLLERLIGNLVENAVRHNVQGGWVSVSTSQDGGWSNVVVSNSGPPLDPVQVPSLVEPFRRGETDRTWADGGFGLGLSIVDAIAGAHEGSLSMSALPEGGLEVSVALPARCAEVRNSENAVQGSSDPCWWPWS